MEHTASFLSQGPQAFLTWNMAPKDTFPIETLALVVCRAIPLRNTAHGRQTFPVEYRLGGEKSSEELSVASLLKVIAHFRLMK